MHRPCEKDIPTLKARAKRLIGAERDFLEQLAQRRENSGVTLDELAERMGTSTETLRLIEHQEGDPTLSIIRRYALAIGAIVIYQVVD